MTPRENLLSLFRRQGYDKAAIQFYLCPSLEKSFQQKHGTGLSWQEYFDLPMREVELPGLPPSEPIDWSRYYPDGLKEEVEFDLWGVAHESGSAAAAHMTRMRHPMAKLQTLEQIQSYPFPDFLSIDISETAEKIKSLHTQGLCVYGPMECTVWETAWYLRDITVLMMDMSMAVEKATWLLDKVTDLACIRAKQYAACDVDLLRLGDDVGMQSALMMSEDFYRQFLKPRLAKVIRSAREVKPDILIQYHSCGFVTPLIGDFIEAGIDIFNPVQPECMDFSELHEAFGDRVSFSGTIGTQTTMPFGTPEQVRELTFRNLDIAGGKGGLLCCPTHLLEPEVPWENIEAYVRACRDYK